MSRVMQGLVVLCLLWSASVHAATLTHGPLLGNVTPSSAVVWVRTSGEATVVAEWSVVGQLPRGDGVLERHSRSVGLHSATRTDRLDRPPPCRTECGSYEPRAAHGDVVTPVKRFRTAPPLGVPTTMVLPVFSDWHSGQPFPGLADGDSARG